MGRSNFLSEKADYTLTRHIASLNLFRIVGKSIVKVTSSLVTFCKKKRRSLTYLSRGDVSSIYPAGEIVTLLVRFANAVQTRNVG